MKIIDVKKLKANEQNPRTIDEGKLELLKQSVKDFDAMLHLRPIVVDENMVILGGNMRFKAISEVGHKKVPVEVFTRDMADKMNSEKEALGEPTKTYEEYCAEFIIKDNVAFGEWNMEVLYDDFDPELLASWGLEVYEPKEEIKVDDFFNEPNREIEDQPQKFVIVLDYSEEEFEAISNAMKGRGETREQIFWNALGLV